MRYLGSAPSPRVDLAMAYDPLRRNVVMYGGYTAETWIWDGAWTQRAAIPSPSARGNPGLAWDGQFVTLFGGYDGNVTDFSDTWSWDGTTWTLRTTAHSPPRRSNPAMAFDPIRKVVVMFGGTRDIAGFDLGDTWQFDGSDWTQVMSITSPPARSGSALVWNAARQKLVLPGGGVSSVDTWELDAAGWHSVGVPDLPPTRASFGAATTFDGAGIVLYGGTDGVTIFSDRIELRWDGPAGGEACDGSDLDGDTLVACADPDCWPVCAPSCPPATSCASSAPHCGDGTCDPAETCRTCPTDCTCAPVCGDLICDPGETGCPGDC